MAYKVIILYQLYMPSYFLGTFTEYPYLLPFFPGTGSDCATAVVPITNKLAIIIVDIRFIVI